VIDTRARNAQVRPPRETFARGWAAARVDCNQHCPHGPHLYRRIRISKVVGLPPKG